MLKRLILIFLFSFLVSPLYAASFDCNKATTETEIAICSDPELSALDKTMAEIWGSQEREPDEIKLQANWLVSRNACEGRSSPYPRLI